MNDDDDDDDEPMPNMNQSTYNLRSQPVFGQIRARTDKYKASFFLDSLLEWSKLDPEIRQSMLSRADCFYLFHFSCFISSFEP